MVIKAAIGRNIAFHRACQPDAAKLPRQRLRIVNASVVSHRILCTVPKLNSVLAVGLTQVIFNNVIGVTVMTQIADTVAPIPDKLVSLYLDSLHSSTKEQAICQIAPRDAITEFAIR